MGRRAPSSSKLDESTTASMSPSTNEGAATRTLRECTLSEPLPTRLMTAAISTAAVATATKPVSARPARTRRARRRNSATGTGSASGTRPRPDNSCSRRDSSSSIVTFLFA